jgi:hypothetical protein
MALSELDLDLVARCVLCGNVTGSRNAVVSREGVFCCNRCFRRIEDPQRAEMPQPSPEPQRR